MNLAAARVTATPALLGIDPNPPRVAGAKADELRVAPDGHPARVVKAHNVHKAGFITKYAHTVAVAMKNRWPARAYIDTHAGPGVCWVQDTGEFVRGSPLISTEASPRFTHYIFVDTDSRCTAALERRLAGTGATIITADSNAPATIDAVRHAFPRPQLSLPRAARPTGLLATARHD